MENSITKSFIDSINNESISVAKDISVLALDVVITDETLKHVPILGTLVSIYKVGKSIKEAHTFRKIAVFLSRLSDISDEEKEAFLDELSADEKYKESIFEKVLLLIERLDETVKAEIVGNLFRLYVMQVINKERFIRLSAIVERAILYDLLYLHCNNSLFSDSSIRQSDYPYNSDTVVALYNLGLMDQEVKIKGQQTQMGSSPDIKPTIRYKQNSLGMLLANLMFYNKDNNAFIHYIEQERQRTKQRMARNTND